MRQGPPVRPGARPRSIAFAVRPGHPSGRSRPPEPPMSDESLCYLTATQALAKFKSRKLSPVELLDALIDRAERVEPKINAFWDRYFDEARKAAKKAEARYMGKGADPRPLEGIAVGLKDVARLAGKRTTQGSLTFKNKVEKVSDPMVERLLDAGAIFHAQDERAGVLPVGHLLHAHVRRDAQSAQSRLRAGRLLGRVGRLARVRHIDARDRHRHRRLDPHSGRRLRPLRLQAAAWAQSGSLSGESRSIQSLRPAGALGRRCGAVPEHRVGRPSARSRLLARSRQGLARP